MADSNRKDSTNELPMYDLEEAINLTVQIHEKALETSAMPDVAKGCGYANPTSTPFYRRIVAARLFKFLNAPKAELTTAALDYLKPDTDEAKQNALTQAIMGIKVYADIVNLHLGKRINSDQIANKLEKDDGLLITKACAKTCAAVLVSSLKFAGFFLPDGTVAIPGGNIVAKKVVPLADPLKPKFAGGGNGELESDEESQIQTLYLDGKRKRKITIKAPFTVTNGELERIRAWLGFQLIVEEQIASPDEAKTPE